MKGDISPGNMAAYTLKDNCFRPQKDSTPKTRFLRVYLPLHKDSLLSSSSDSHDSHDYIYSKVTVKFRKLGYLCFKGLRFIKLWDCRARKHLCSKTTSSIIVFFSLVSCIWKSSSRKIKFLNWSSSPPSRPQSGHPPAVCPTGPRIHSSQREWPLDSEP